MLVVDRSRPVAAPAPTAIGEGAHGGISCVKDAGICAVAVKVGRGGPGLDRTGPIDLGVEKRIDVDGSTECVLRPAAGAGNVAAVERRSFVVLHGQFVVSVRIVLDGADLLDGIAQLNELLEDRDD